VATSTSSIGVGLTWGCISSKAIPATCSTLYDTQRPQ